MCGICGWINPRGLDPRCLIEMNNRAAHRGPDGEGYWLWQGSADVGRFLRDLPPPDNGSYMVGLGHRRLAILDLSDQGIQPMSACNGQLWIVFNGEIYNYIELRAELSKNGYVFLTGTDTEVILAAYLAWGTDCFTRFNGMWGLGIVDVTNGKLILSRDRLGIKPLYYWARKQAFAFASEIKQLLALPDISATVNLNTLVEYINTGYESPEQTFFQDIQPFPPGHWTEIDLVAPRTPEPHSFWSIPDQSTIKVTFKTAAEKTQSLFEDAVRIRMRSDVPVGVCLSGGLDSSAIFAQMQLLANENGTTHAFSAAFEDPLFDERKYIKLVLSQFGGEAHYTFPSAESFLDGFDKFIYHHDEPPGSLSQYAAWDVMRLARQHQVPVILNGQGGDELFTGYWPAYYLYLRQTVTRAPWTVIQHLIGSLLPGGNPEFVRQLPPHLLQYKHRLSQQSRDVLNPEIVTKGSRQQNWALVSQKITPDQYRLQEITKVHLPRLLKWDDRNSMAFSIEGRYPFLDYRLVEWILSLPPEINLGSGWNKLLLRRSLSHLLPREIQWRRSKIGFVTPQSKWLSTSLQQPVVKWLHNPSFRLRPLINLSKVKEIGLALYDHEHIHQMNEYQFLVMRLFFLDRWLSIFGVDV